MTHWCVHGESETGPNQTKEAVAWTNQAQDSPNFFCIDMEKKETKKGKK